MSCIKTVLYLLSNEIDKKWQCQNFFFIRLWHKESTDLYQNKQQNDNKIFCLGAFRNHNKLIPIPLPKKVLALTNKAPITLLSFASKLYLHVPYQAHQIFDW